MFKKNRFEIRIYEDKGNGNASLFTRRYKNRKMYAEELTADILNTARTASVVETLPNGTERYLPVRRIAYIDIVDLEGG